MRYRMMFTGAAAAVLLAPLTACGLGDNSDCDALQNALDEAGTLEDPVVFGNALQDEAQSMSDQELKEAVELMGRMWVALGDDDPDAMLDVASLAEAEAAADLIEEECGGTNLPSF